MVGACKGNREWGGERGTMAIDVCLILVPLSTGLCAAVVGIDLLDMKDLGIAVCMSHLFLDSQTLFPSLFDWITPAL